MAATLPLSTTTRPAAGRGMSFEPRWCQPQEWATVDTPSTRPSTRGQRLAPGVYHRRRLAVGIVLAVIGAMAWTAATWATNSSIGVDPVGADRSGAPEIYIVQPGDTLWTVAAALDSTGDVRDTVDQLADLNGGSALTVGQRLIIGS